jgi:transposase-like protein
MGCSPIESEAMTAESINTAEVQNIHVNAGTERIECPYCHSAQVHRNCTREQVRYMRCDAPGCGRSFKVAISLKYFIVPIQ